MPNNDSSSTLSGSGGSATIAAPLTGASSAPNPMHYSRGYQKLSCLMGRLPEFAVYKRFGALNTLNLLYLQTELADLERQLHETSEIAAYSPDLLESRSDFDWTSIVRTDASGNHTEQYKLIIQIRGALQQYNEQLWLQSQITRLSKPYETDVHWLRRWMCREKNGNLQCRGLEEELWHKTPHEDLVAIRAREYSDTWTNFFATRFVILYHRHIGRYIHKVSDESELIDNVVYTERSGARWMAALTASLSSAFPVASIVILNEYENIHIRLGILAIFTILFSAALAVLSPNKKLEVFAASAAFAAVLVVFIKN